jgi:hypothetical protein
MSACWLWRAPKIMGARPHSERAHIIMGARPHSERAPIIMGARPQFVGGFGDFLLFFMQLRVDDF